MHKKILLLIIRGYRYAVSPLLGNHCRFYPSCSQYAVEAIETHGVGRGLWLTCQRLLRCHPWHSGGVDLVPELELESGVNNSEQRRSAQS